MFGTFHLVGWLSSLTNTKPSVVEKSLLPHRRIASLIWERVEDRRYSLYFKGFMFVLTGGSTSPNIPSVMDEIVFKLELFSTFNSSYFLRRTSSSPRRWTPTSRPVEYISTGVYATSSFSSSISLHPETWETYSQRKAEGFDEDCTCTLQTI